MGNHYHLLLRDPRNDLPAAMQAFGSQFVRHTNDRIGRDEPMFRGRFLSIPVTTEEYLTWVTRYIHRNPLAIAGVRAADEYRWSSYRTYLGHRRAPRYVNTDLVSELFDHDASALARFTEADRSDRSDVLRVPDVVDFVASAIAREVMRSDVDVRQADRTLNALLQDRGVVVDERPRTAAARAARNRAKRRLEQDPTVQRILDDLLRSLGRAA